MGPETLGIATTLWPPDSVPVSCIADPDVRWRLTSATEDLLGQTVKLDDGFPNGNTDKSMAGFAVVVVADDHKDGSKLEEALLMAVSKPPIAHN